MATSALHPSGIVLPNIHQTVLTHLNYFYPRVPSCRALMTTGAPTPLQTRVQHPMCSTNYRDSSVKQDPDCFCFGAYSCCCSALSAQMRRDETEHPQVGTEQLLLAAAP